MKFKEGDIVICIDIRISTKPIVFNKQYTIDKIYDGGTYYSNCISLTEFGNQHFFAYRFKLDKKYYRKEKLKQLRNEI
jgi:hypothetical protein